MIKCKLIGRGKECEDDQLMQNLGASFVKTKDVQKRISLRDGVNDKIDDLSQNKLLNNRLQCFASSSKFRTVKRCQFKVN